MAGIHNPVGTLLARIQGVRLGREVRFVGIPLIAKTRGSKMSIGSNCVVNSSFLSNLAGLYQRCILVARDGGELKIGENTGLSGATVYAKESIEIGRDCLIGANAKILTPTSTLPIRKSGSPIPMRGRGPPSASATTSS